MFYTCIVYELPAALSSIVFPSFFSYPDNIPTGPTACHVPKKPELDWEEHQTLKKV